MVTPPVNMDPEVLTVRVPPMVEFAETMRLVDEAVPETVRAVVEAKGNTDEVSVDVATKYVAIKGLVEVPTPPLLVMAPTVMQVPFIEKHPPAGKSMPLAKVEVAVPDTVRDDTAKEPIFADPETEMVSNLEPPEELDDMIIGEPRVTPVRVLIL